MRGIALRTQSDCFGTPSAAGSSPSSSRSSPQKLGLRIGAGVTGRLGRSISVGKSVSFMLGRRPSSGMGGDISGSEVVCSEGV